MRQAFGGDDHGNIFAVARDDYGITFFSSANAIGEFGFSLSSCDFSSQPGLRDSAQ